LAFVAPPGPPVPIVTVEGEVETLSGAPDPYSKPPPPPPPAVDPPPPPPPATIRIVADADPLVIVSAEGLVNMCVLKPPVVVVVPPLAISCPTCDHALPV
jgi:hypothetical protein